MALLRSILTIALASAAVNAFSVPAARLPLAAGRATGRMCGATMQLKPEAGEATTADSYTSRMARVAMPAVPTGLLLSQMALPLQEAAAAGGQYGLIEGKAVALIHPAIMGALYFFTLWTGYQGLQWRTLREVGNDLKPLQAEEKKLLAEKESLVAAEQSTASVDSKLSEVSAEVAELTAKRKDLLSGDFRDKHWMSASLLLASGVTFSIEGCFDTYFRAGKLFPGPHLFAGAGITVLWAIAASLVPKMQKGDETARSAHIAINTIIVGLFSWQIQSGLGILNNVWTKTAWFPVIPPPA
mmetsp:Transcript_51575/g.104982  ORF Transcript_51575/g.104982 Transcript_51575/m.104982 type:complete len:299 (-) Transcript_51575:155-1051(-)